MNVTRRDLLKGAAALGASGAVPGAFARRADAQARTLPERAPALG